MTQTRTETIDNKTYSLIHYYDGNECYDTVKECSERFWKSAPKTDSIENYQFGADAKSWSLGPMLLNNGFEHGYSVLSINDKPWAFAGVRKYTDDIALVLARLFCFHTVKPISYGLMLPFHLKIARQQGYKKAWTTFNAYNIHLYNTWIVKEFNNNKKHKRNNVMYEENDKMISTSKCIGEVMVNNTKQTVIEWDL
jgi:hypothetical protein